MFWTLFYDVDFHVILNLVSDDDDLLLGISIIFGGEEMLLKNVIKSEMVILDLNAKNRNDAIEELVDLLYNGGYIIDKKEFNESVRYREGLASTYCGFELAIPHGISKTVKKPGVCFGRTTGIDWDGDGETQVKYIFLIAIPYDENNKDESNKHIKILSSIASLGLKDKIREKWSKAETKEEFLKTLHEI